MIAVVIVVVVEVVIVAAGAAVVSSSSSSSRRRRRRRKRRRSVTLDILDGRPGARKCHTPGSGCELAASLRYILIVFQEYSEYSSIYWKILFKN